jgi:hypothetical protein
MHLYDSRHINRPISNYKVASESVVVWWNDRHTRNPSIW